MNTDLHGLLCAGHAAFRERAIFSQLASVNTPELEIHADTITNLFAAITEGEDRTVKRDYPFGGQSTNPVAPKYGTNAEWVAQNQSKCRPEQPVWKRPLLRFGLRGWRFGLGLLVHQRRRIA